MSAPSGFLLVDKPAGPTSAAVTRQLGHALNTKTGHLGTLDPMATGLLVVCVGNALKLVPYLQKGVKRYLAEITFGQATDTYDAQGEVTRIGPVPEDLQVRVRKALKRFSGDVLQKPPPFSAIRVDGSRLLKKARKGEAVELPDRPVTFYDVRVTNSRPSGIVLDVQCSAGTYIRSLAHDLGQAIRVPACLTALRRVESHPFHVDAAVSLDGLLSDAALPQSFVVPVEEYLPTLPRITLSPEEARSVHNGVALAGARVRAGTCLLMTEAGQLLALGESIPAEDRVKIRRVIAT
jgi:tRNA pseudouridine55 synthase